MKTTAGERKSLLAARYGGEHGAMFGSPLSAALLAMELLLLRSRELLPLADQAHGRHIPNRRSTP
jgi:H+/Cl- antiporter ClcA